jgi:hypothetical protein
MTIKNFVVAAATASAISGCTASIPVHLYPEKGPLARQNPTPVVVATAHNVISDSGPFEVVLPGNVECKGNWSSIAPKAVSTSWGSIFSLAGSGTAVSTTASIVPGVNPGQFYAICSDNRKIEGEFVTGSGTASGTGAARDSKGNVFKMIF